MKPRSGPRGTNRPKPRARGLKRSGLRALASEALQARTTQDNSPEWTHFLREIDDVRERMGYSRTWRESRECYFRGQINAGWDVSPSLFRVPVPKGEDREEYWWQLETDLYYEFRARAREVHVRMLSSWDVLFTMQHHRVPTRLLDWTEVFALALFFALDGYEPEQTAPPCIWILDPYALNRWSWGVDDLVAPANLGWDARRWDYWTYDELLLDGAMDWNAPTAVYPELRNSRLHAQRGAFTIHGDETDPLNVQLGAKRNVLQRVVLPKAAIPDAVRFLRQAGVNRSSIYPEMEGLALSLRQKYGLERGYV